ncbi:MAG: MerR family transcriptional regulator, partial [Christensenellaceae bacterium]|nr:MerR family transcriptional regulator [Christensenellaceae bacterium]
MEKTYTVGQLAALSALSARTLRYWEEIGLLVPARQENGYRRYGKKEVARLQEILFCRKLGMEAADIGKWLADRGGRKQVLHAQLEKIEKEQERLELLRQNLIKSLLEEEGEADMEDREKFAGLRLQALKKHEEQYGKEARAKYGDA